MSKEKFRGAPPVAKHDLDTSSVEYKELSTLVWSVFDYVLGKLDMRARQDFYIASLLKSMRETHKSMRAILGVAADYEKQTGQQTGSHYDAVLLARPQIESVFIGLLILYDERKYVPWYQKAGWAAGARARHYYCISVSDATPIGMQWCRNAQDMYKKIAISLGITKAEEEATYAYIRGDELTDEEKDNRIKEFPTVGKMMDEQNKDGHMLKGSSFEGLAELLLRQWKFLCDSAHVSERVLARKSFLRGDSIVRYEEEGTRDEMMSQEVHHHSIVPSMVAILSLLTAYATEHKDDTALLLKLGEAWKWFAEGTAIGSFVWNGWAREALGILSDQTSPETN